MNKFKNFNRVVDKLSCVQRFSQFTLSKPEDTLSHTGKVALLCVQISESLLDEGIEIDQGLLLKKALVHDLEESLIGDVVRPVKYHSAEMRNCFKNLEAETMAKIVTSCFNGAEIVKAWTLAKKEKEGSIVSFVDTMCALATIENEIFERGNNSMKAALTDTCIETIRKRLEEMESYFPESKTMRELRDYTIDICERLELVRNHVRGNRTL